MLGFSALKLPVPRSDHEEYSRFSSTGRPAYDRISIGFPGVIRNGRVITAPHLGTKAWRDFPLEKTIADNKDKIPEGDVTTLTDSTVMDLISEKMPTAPAED